MAVNSDSFNEIIASTLRNAVKDTDKTFKDYSAEAQLPNNIIEQQKLNQQRYLGAARESAGQYNGLGAQDSLIEEIIYTENVYKEALRTQRNDNVAYQIKQRLYELLQERDRRTAVQLYTYSYDPMRFDIDYIKSMPRTDGTLWSWSSAAAVQLIDATTNIVAVQAEAAPDPDKGKRRLDLDDRKVEVAVTAQKRVLDL